MSDKMSNVNGSKRNQPKETKKQKNVVNESKKANKVDQPKPLHDDEKSQALKENELREKLRAISRMSRTEDDLDDKEKLLEENKCLKEKLEKFEIFNDLPDEFVNKMAREIKQNPQSFKILVEYAIDKSYEGVKTKKKGKKFEEKEIQPEIQQEDKKEIINYTPEIFLDEARAFLTIEPLALQQAAEKIDASYSMAFKMCCQKIGLRVDGHNAMRQLSCFTSFCLNEPTIYDACISAGKAHAFFYKSSYIPDLEKCYDDVQSFLQIYQKLNFGRVKKELEKLVKKGKNNAQYKKNWALWIL